MQSFVMIITILMLIILLPALIGWGFLAEQVFRFKIFHGISGKIFCGTFSVSVFLTIIAFFSGITVYAEGIILGIGILFFFREKFYLNLYSFLKNSGFGFLSTAMVCIICASFYPFILDHFGYYVPTKIGRAHV